MEQQKGNTLLQFGSKAQTLEALGQYYGSHGTPGKKNDNISVVILPMFYFSVSEWHCQVKRKRILQEIQQRFGTSTVIVRSSSFAEDSVHQSMAGAFTSVPNVNPGDATALSAAIETVIQSYNTSEASTIASSGRDHVLIQEQLLQRTNACGVLFTAELTTRAPYYVCSFDTMSTRTDVVTSGEDNVLTLYRLKKDGEGKFAGEESLQGTDDDKQAERKAQVLPPPAAAAPSRFAYLDALFSVAQELERLFGNSELDIEFAIIVDDDEEEEEEEEDCVTTSSKFSTGSTAVNGAQCFGVVKVFLFQVRPLPALSSATIEADQHIHMRANLKNIFDHIHRENASCQDGGGKDGDLHGHCVVYGVMPDWNPAEIIGIHPKQLALSLYREVITDRVWAESRASYGYKNVVGNPLMVNLGGFPYIDVRNSFNSFLPATLPSTIAEKIVHFCLEKLKSHPELHDKIEFEIAFTCYYPGIELRMERELIDPGVLTRDEAKIFLQCLRDLTNDIIDLWSDKSLFMEDMRRVEELKLRQQRWQKIEQDESNEQSINAPGCIIARLSKMNRLIEDCKLGTHAFSGLARAGFIGVQMLNSLVDEEIISAEERQLIMDTRVSTISKELQMHVSQLADGSMSQETFLSFYGHLRPGTYDISSKRYDEAFETYFHHLMMNNDPNVEQPGEPGEGAPERTDASVKVPPFSFSEVQSAKLIEVLRHHGLTVNPEQYLDFIIRSIEARESSKLVFSKNISDFLREIDHLGRDLGISTDDIAHLDVQSLLDWYKKQDDASSLGASAHRVITDSIRHSKSIFSAARLLQMPPLICSPDDVYEFVISADKPNFITLNSVQAHVVREEDLRQRKDLNLEGKIVCISSADPGWDWLFTNGIAGIITEFGGVNSHMAIRTAELGIPGVIGCGPALFKLWSSKTVLQIDCRNKTINIIH